MEWASLSALYRKGAQGIWEFPSERNHPDNSSAHTFDLPATTPLQPQLPFQSGVNGLHLANDLPHLTW